MFNKVSALENYFDIKKSDFAAELFYGYGEESLKSGVHTRVPFWLRMGGAQYINSNLMLKLDLLLAAHTENNFECLFRFDKNWTFGVHGHFDSRRMK
jgi:hypothetical protein